MSRSSSLPTCASHSGRKMKVASQKMKESMGKAIKTVDLELDAKLAVARQTQKDYLTLISLLNSTSGTLMLAGKAQMALGECMNMLAGNDRTLRADFKCHATIQVRMTRAKRQPSTPPSPSFSPLDPLGVCVYLCICVCGRYAQYHADNYSCGDYSPTATPCMPGGMRPHDSRI